MQNKLPSVAIVGRPNVGKSTLFNRLIQKRVSIMHDSAGVTRDRVFHTCEWLSRRFNIIDSGGFSHNLNLSFQKEINTQVKIAMEEADIIIFLVSVIDGITKEDIVVASMLKKLTNKKIIVAVNKSDNLELSISASNFYSIGLGEPIGVSSIHGIGISELLDKIISLISNPKEIEIKNSLRVGIIGKPNVGKSTLLNCLLKDERTIVSNVAGTTRDSIDTILKIDNKEIVLTDTAGLKKNKQSLDEIEWYAELRTQLTIINSDVSILLIDKNQSITQIDEKILGILKDEFKPVVIAINKIDELSNEERKEVELEIRNKFKFAPWVPIIFISAKEGKNVNKLMKKVIELGDIRKINLSKSILNQFLSDIQMIKKPPRHNGVNIKLNYITFSNTRFPHFIIFSNHPQWVHFSYIRFIENQIRNVFDLEGIPIKISIRGKGN
ncbi:MAG: GTPase Der [Candidatus Tyloplasma litorale]|nr:MAG: GTPase Der [Mycoplasmatales bacterium]